MGAGAGSLERRAMLDLCALSASGFAYMREWLHVVFATTRTNRHQGTGGETRKQLPRVRQGSTRIDARLDAVPPSVDSTPRNYPYGSKNDHDYDAASRDSVYVSLSALRCSDLRELRIYRVLQCSPLRRGGGIGSTGAGGGNWLALHNLLLPLQRALR
jgi:hypothetical protein